MLVKTGSYTGNGTRKFIELGFRPNALIIKANTTAAMAFWQPHMWCSRSGSFGQLSSYISGVTDEELGFYVGSAAQVNTDAVVHHYIALGVDNSSDDLDQQSWAGNQTAGRAIKLGIEKTPIAAIIKRDSNLEAALKIDGNTTIFMQGTAATDCIALGSGQVTLTAATHVNQYDSAGGLGEGIEGLFLFDSANCKIITWIGDGTEGRVIPTGLSNPVAALISNPAAGGSSRLITNTMGGSVAPVTAGAGLIANEATIAGGNIVIGTSETVLNGSGSQYGAIVWEEKTTAKRIYVPSIKIKNRQAVYLPGLAAASYINCGVSDATLLIDGSITYEFCGAVWFNPLASAIVDGIIIARGHPTNGGIYGGINGYSWSLLCGAPNDGSLGWGNAQWAPQTSNMMSLAVPLDTSNWRTGIIAKFGQVQHVIASINTDGTHVLYVDGKMVKQRKNATPQIDSVAGHITVIGARVSGGVAARNTKMLLRELAIYNVALTADQARARYERAMLGSTDVADVTTGRAAWWNADNAGGAILPDAVNAANNGTISAGVVLTL